MKKISTFLTLTIATVLCSLICGTASAQWSGGTVVVNNNDVSYTGNCTWNATYGQVTASTPSSGYTSSISLVYKQTWTNTGNADTLSLWMYANVSGASSSPQCGSGVMTYNGHLWDSVTGNYGYTDSSSWMAYSGVSPTSLDALFYVYATAHGSGDNGSTATASGSLAP